MLTKILVTEEDHVDWLETQIGLIDKLGEAIYLAEQLRSLARVARIREKARPRRLFELARG